MRDFYILLLTGLCAISSTAQVKVTSPDKEIVAELSANGGRLTYSVEFRGHQVLASSPIGIEVGIGTFGGSEVMGKPAISTFRERFPWRGNKSEVVVRGKRAMVPMKSAAGEWQLEIVCFDDAVAWRGIILGSGSRKVKGESSAWVFPPGTVAWCNPVTSNCEGIHERWAVNEIPRDKFTNGIAMPITFELPGGVFAALMEAEVMGYSGMTLEPTGTTKLAASFRNDASGWTMDGAIRTPWRVLMVAPDLNALVNCDAVASLCSSS